MTRFAPNMLQLNPSPEVIYANGAAPSLAPGERRFHLLVESVVEPARARRDRAHPAAAFSALEVPAEVSYLAPAGSSPVPVSAPPSEPALVLEPVRVSGRTRLLMASPPELRVRLNGAPVPIFTLLKVGDRLTIGELALYVSEYRDGRPTAPSADIIGGACGVCRLPIDGLTRVYTCDCGVALHLEGPPKPESERLECALFGDCPNCAATVQPECGHVWLPEI